LQKQEYDSVT